MVKVDDRRLHWKAEIGGREKEWDAEITEQIPDQRIAWKSLGGAMNQGMVTFESLSDQKSLIQLNIAYEPEGVVETVGDESGAVTGSWRGSVK